MADFINRIVPSSVNLNRSSWRRRREKDKQEGKDDRTGNLPSYDPVGPAVKGVAEPEFSESDTEKGKNLDVNL